MRSIAEEMCIHYSNGRVDCVSGLSVWGLCTGIIMLMTVIAIWKVRRK